MKITAVHVDTLELAYAEPFVIASSALAAGPCDLVRVETDEGITGYGEACPAYEFTGETLWTAEDVIGEYLAPSIIGRDPFDLEAINHVWDRELYTVGNQAARAGVELALWDIQGKALGRPVCDLIGGRARPALQEVVAFGWDDPEALAADTLAMKALGIHIFKIKVGDTPERDEQRVAAVREAAGPDARITVDANQGWWDAKTAVRAIKLLERYGIEFAEQPVRMDDLEAARFVRAHVDVPIALDESVRGPREALACAKAEACDMFVVKLMKTGGILERAEGQRDRRGRRHQGHDRQHGRELRRHVRALPRQHRAGQRRARRRRPAVARGRAAVRHRPGHPAGGRRRGLVDRRPRRAGPGRGADRGERRAPAGAAALVRR